jgi:hypothetical protein
MRMFRALLAAALSVGLTGCGSSPRTQEPASAAGDRQSIGPEMKRLYMACSAAPRQSPQQQKLVRQMAETASNGQELLMTMRASIGVFPGDAAASVQKEEHAVRSLVAAKLIKAGNLEELTQFAVQYTVNREDSRPLVERMFELASANRDPAQWQQVARAARGVSALDLAQQALAQREALTHR